MTRREFLKGTAGLILLCGAGFGLEKLEKALSPSLEDAVGPKLDSNLTILQLGNEAEAYLDGRMVFRANGTGANLLRLADGSRTLENMIETAGCKENAGDCVSFFVTLGKAGYLENRIEVNQFERRT